MIQTSESFGSISIDPKDSDVDLFRVTPFFKRYFNWVNVKGSEGIPIIQTSQIRVMGFLR